MSVMNSHTTQNQDKFMITAPDQSPQEFDQDLRIHTLAIDHKSNLTLIGNTGYHVYTHTLG